MEDTITRSIKIMNLNIDNSILNIGEKQAIKKLLETLLLYYDNELNECINKGAYEYKMRLITRMTDYIVAINNTINGQNDAFSIVNMIYKEINYDKKKGYFKRKRLIY